MNAIPPQRLEAAQAEELARMTPAPHVPELSDERHRALRTFLMNETIDALGQARHRCPRRRVLLAAIVAGAILLLCGTAVYATRVVPPPLASPPTPAADTLMTARQVRAEYRLWTHRIELPPGVKWRRERRLGKGGDGSGDMYGGNTGAMDAITWAWCAWSREWIAAAKVQDEVRVAAAAAAIDRLRSAMPAWHEGMSENQGGWDSASLENFDAVIADAKRGDFGGLRQIAGWFGGQE